MTWAYSTSLAADKDRVRLYIGDTDTNNQQFSDEEINALLTDNADDIFETSAQFCDSLAAKYARSNSLRIDGFSISLDKRSEHWRPDSGRNPAAPQGPSRLRSLLASPLMRWIPREMIPIGTRRDSRSGNLPILEMPSSRRAMRTGARIEPII